MLKLMWSWCAYEQRVLAFGWRDSFGGEGDSDKRSAAHRAVMSSEAAPTPTRLFVCVVGVWLTWTAHDYLQERIFKAPGFRFGLFMAFSLQTVSFILSLAYRIGVGLLDRSQAQRGKEEEARRLRAVEEEEEQGAGLMEENEPPVETKPSGAEPLSALVWYLLLSLLIAAANGSASAALQYVNMQVKLFLLLRPSSP